MTSYSCTPHAINEQETVVHSHTRGVIIYIHFEFLYVYFYFRYASTSHKSFIENKVRLRKGESKSTVKNN